MGIPSASYSTTMRVHTCNAVDARHADAITQAVGVIEGAEVHTVSDRNLSFLHSGARAA